jgi:hypothetical protein
MEHLLLALEEVMACTGDPSAAASSSSRKHYYNAS